MNYENTSIAYNKLINLQRANTSFILKEIVRRKFSRAKSLYQYSGMRTDEGYCAINCLVKAGVVSVETSKPANLYIFNEESFCKVVSVINSLAEFHGEKVPGHLPLRDGEIFKVK